MASEIDLTDDRARSNNKPSWWDRYATEVLSKTKDRRGRTTIFSRWLTLRIVPTELRTKHHRELFDGWGEAGRPLFEAYEAIGKVWDDAYSSVSIQQTNVQAPQQEVISYMTVSGFEKVLTRQFPYAALRPGEILQLLKHVRDEWVTKRKFVLRLIPDGDLIANRWLSLRTSSWDTIAKASSLAVWRGLDYSLFWFADGEDGKRVAEADNLLDRIHNLSRETPWDYYIEWADLLCKHKTLPR